MPHLGAPLLTASVLAFFSQNGSPKTNRHRPWLSMLLILALDISAAASPGGRGVQPRTLFIRAEGPRLRLRLRLDAMVAGSVESGRVGHRDSGQIVSVGKGAQELFLQVWGEQVGGAEIGDAAAVWGIEERCRCDGGRGWVEEGWL